MTFSVNTDLIFLNSFLRCVMGLGAKWRRWCQRRRCRQCGWHGRLHGGFLWAGNCTYFNCCLHSHQCHFHVVPKFYNTYISTLWNLISYSCNLGFYFKKCAVCSLPDACAPSGSFIFCVRETEIVRTCNVTNIFKIKWKFPPT